MLEYLLGTYCASNDENIIQDGLQTVKRVLAENYVYPDEAEKTKSIIRERGSLKIIDKVTVALNERRDVYEALLANLGVKGVEVDSVRDIATIPGELFAKFQTSFYADATDAVFKAVGVE